MGLTPGHFEAGGQDSSSDDRPAGTAGSVRFRDELDHLARVTLPFRVVCCHLEGVHEYRQLGVGCFRSENQLLFAQSRGQVGKSHYVSR